MMNARPAVDRDCAPRPAQLTEIIFLGTGTSGCLPNITCLVGQRPRHCRACIPALTPEGRKNRRRNTSILARWLRADGSTFTLLVDCGKSFYEAALDWFPRFAITRIDAVFLTHGHADAILGLDDLRTFSVKQQQPIPVFATPDTLEVVATTFPYLLDRSKATGSGDVASLDFREVDSSLPILITPDIQVLPLPVHHGTYNSGEIFYNYGLRMDNVAYIADVNYIPEKTRRHLEHLELVVLDALQIGSVPSHFSFSEAILECGRIGATRSLLTDFAHALEHEEMIQHLQQSEQSSGVYIRPAFDGLHLVRIPIAASPTSTDSQSQYDWIEQPNQDA